MPIIRRGNDHRNKKRPRRHWEITRRINASPRCLLMRLPGKSKVVYWEDDWNTVNRTHSICRQAVDIQHTQVKLSSPQQAARSQAKSSYQVIRVWIFNEHQLQRIRELSSAGFQGALWRDRLSYTTKASGTGHRRWPQGERNLKRKIAIVRRCVHALILFDRSLAGAYGGYWKFSRPSRTPGHADESMRIQVKWRRGVENLLGGYQTLEFAEIWADLKGMSRGSASSVSHLPVAFGLRAPDVDVYWAMWLPTTKNHLFTKWKLAMPNQDI